MSGSTLTRRSDLEIEVGLAAPEPGPRTLAPFGRRLCRVCANEQAGSYRLVGVEDPDGPAPLPGQFYMLAASEGWGESSSQRPYLARAFSVCRVRGERLDFLVDAIGPGTRRLAALVRGEGLWLVGPLGVGFSAPSELATGGERASAVLMGGGAGVAPLVIWQEALRAAGTATVALLGFRSAPYSEVAGLFSGDVAIATDDGSAGHQGLVTELLAQELERGTDQVVYACGPPAMLEEVRRISLERSVAAELAMEEAMACGFGACFGCAVRTKTGYRRLCVDGPVIAAADLDEGWTG
jgi:dihydroorotate dehydrogenase electron transfer subunit